MPYGYRFQIGVMRTTEPDPNARRGGGRWGAVVIVVLALAAVAILVWPARNAPAEPAPAAHIAVAPAAPAKPAPSPVILHVTPQSGAICILPNGKTTGPVELAEVP
jgi:hypothetical protein